MENKYAVVARCSDSQNRVTVWSTHKSIDRARKACDKNARVIIVSSHVKKGDELWGDVVGNQSL